MKKMKSKVFISHSYNDRSLVERLIYSLIKRGVNIITDPFIEHHSDEDVEEKFREALSESKYVLSILTPESLRSPWVNFELGAALFMNKDLIPVISKEVPISDIPSPLQRYKQLKIEDDVEETARKIVAELDLRENERSQDMS
ncbi:MAG: toll/interleukin-1 receptor domain-containing protein [Anaerolineae bacterium]